MNDLFELWDELRDSFGALFPRDNNPANDTCESDTSLVVDVVGETVDETQA